MNDYEPLQVTKTVYWCEDTSVCSIRREAFPQLTPVEILNNALVNEAVNIQKTNYFIIFHLNFLLFDNMFLFPVWHFSFLLLYYWLNTRFLITCHFLKQSYTQILSKIFTLLPHLVEEKNLDFTFLIAKEI